MIHQRCSRQKQRWINESALTIKAQEKTQETNTNASSIFNSNTATDLLRVYVDFANFLLDFCHLSQTNEE
jgi:hypothetical protein